ncbi:MAG: hypothetical protein FWD34_02550 [Oscillospiraceae bacterium]|nr:hypothetical protein [Oscillospiraceae bacterium]
MLKMLDEKLKTTLLIIVTFLIIRLRTIRYKGTTTALNIMENVETYSTMLSNLMPKIQKTMVNKQTAGGIK